MALGAAGAAPAVLGANGEMPLIPLESALVLSGGGAHGAYEAGAIGCWAAARGIADGVPLAPYQMVFGTSIGALNGWMVATGQFTRLRELWYGVSAAKLLRLKPQFAASADPNSGALDQLAAKLRMASLATDQVAMYDSQPVFDFISRQIDPARPLVIPFVWAVTNLTAQRTEFFYRRAADTPAQFHDAIVRVIQAIMGPQTVVREASLDLLHKQLFASAAIPIVWDPVPLPGPDGSTCEYCDGGVASNSSVRISHAVSRAVDVILVDPPFEPVRTYDNAIAITFGLIATMRRKILEIDMRTAHFQSLTKRAFARLPNADAAITAEGDPQFAAYMQSVPATTLSYLRPKDKLPISSEDFDDEEGIGKIYRLGWNDAIAGLTPYDWKTFD